VSIPQRDAQGNENHRPQLHCHPEQITTCRESGHQETNKATHPPAVDREVIEGLQEAKDGRETLPHTIGLWPVKDDDRGGGAHRQASLAAVAFPRQW
jgi:hypothetical protein